MRVLLRDAKSGRYIQTSGLWINRAEYAANFQCSAMAVQFAQEAKLTGVSIVFVFDGHPEEIALPLELFTQAGVIHASRKPDQRQSAGKWNPRGRGRGGKPQLWEGNP